MVRFTYYGHSCFLIEGSKGKIIIDPFLKGNPHIKVSPNEILVNAVLVSHAHADHVGDAVEIAQKNKAPIIGVYELVKKLKSQGATGHEMNIGGSHQFEFGEVTLTFAAHSCGFEDGTYGGSPCGFIIKMDNKTIYHAGDSGLVQDMKLIGEFKKMDFAFLPIGDNFTMGVDNAVIAADYINCNKIIGMHYDTFGFIKIDHKEAKEKFNRAGKELILLNIGETKEI